MASFRSNKQTPEAFGLKPVDGEAYFVDKKGQYWKETYLWEHGWGSEYGFVRYPEPDFEQLWYLLLATSNNINKMGAAELLKQYPEQLKEKLQIIFKKGERIDKKMSKRLQYLEVLQTAFNYSTIEGKKPDEVDRDYQEWKQLKTDFDRLKTESSWRQILGKRSSS